jgi:hypothetical protein
MAGALSSGTLLYDYKSNNNLSVIVENGVPMLPMFATVF